MDLTIGPAPSDLRQETHCEKSRGSKLHALVAIRKRESGPGHGVAARGRLDTADPVSLAWDIFKR